MGYSPYAAQLMREHRERRARWEAQARAFQAAYRRQQLRLIDPRHAYERPDGKEWPDEHWKVIDSFPKHKGRRALRLVCEEFDVPAHHLIGGARFPKNVQARNVAMHLLARRGWSTVQLGLAFGKRDHSTVLHALKRLARMMEDDHGLWERVNAIEEKLA